MRFSASKPDISTDANHNEWKTRVSASTNRMMAQSCPTTPRGSVPDLRDENGEKKHLDHNCRKQLPLYENVGYRSSAAYQSAYRQSHYPTLHEQQISRQRAKSEHSLHNNPQVLNADWTPKKVQQRIIQAPIIQHNGSPNPLPLSPQ
ncbi:unnamed protein product, partial [Mesorhabditis belari]